MTEPSLFEVLDQLAGIEVEHKVWTKEQLDEAEASLHTPKLSVEQAREILSKKILEQTTKSGLFKLLSDSICFVIQNVSYKEEELNGC
jgi:hypothetical protein